MIGSLSPPHRYYVLLCLCLDPGPVNELSGTVDSWHSISIDWNPPTLDGSFVSNYTLTYTATCPGSDETDSGGANFTADQTQETFLSLKGSLTYTFSVAAVNPIGLSEFESITLTTEATSKCTLIDI